MRKVISIMFVAIIIITFGGSSPRAGEIDVLIDKLVEKGILTDSEAKEVLSEIQTERDKQRTEIKRAAVEAAKEEAKTHLAGLPDWMKKIQFKGDLRLRHDTQWIHDDSNNYDRNRERFRLRLGFKAKTSETTEVGVRFASGSGYQNTTNQSFDEHARGKNIFIDKVYASWRPADFLEITGGKHQNPLFTSPLVWDPDVNPEGISESFKFDLTDRINIYSNLGQWFVEELDIKDSDKDTTVMVYQLGTVIKASDKIKLEFAGTYYDFMNLDELKLNGAVLNDKAEFLGYNHTHGQQMIFDSDRKLLNEFGCWELGVKVEVKDIFPIPVVLFGNYINNTETNIDELINKGADPGGSDPAELIKYMGDDRDTGWLIGISMGTKEKKGDWYAKYSYQELEDYAFPAVFVDSDFHNGGTNNKGHFIHGRYYLLDNIQARGSAFFTERESESKDGKRDENRLQLDMFLNF